MFILSHASVSNSYLLLFVVELFVPVLTFLLFRNITTEFISFLISLISIFYLTSIQWWSPDFIIQPLMLTAFLVLVKEKVNYKKIFIIGVISGIIFLLKQNIGVFFIITNGVFIFFSNYSKVIESKRNIKLELIFYIIFICLFLFPVIFWFKAQYNDERIYYLLPYLMFWFVTFKKYLEDKTYFPDMIQFIYQGFTYLIVALILPVSAFIWIGSQFGYEKYYDSLFTMGFKFIKIWDPGIVGYLKPYVVWNSFPKITTSIVHICFLVFPFFAGIISAYLLWSRKLKELVDEKILAWLSFPVMGIFMLFPLEATHIIITKLIIFTFVFFLIFGKNKKITNIIIIILVGLILIRLPLILKKNISFLKGSYVNVEKEIPSIGMRIEKSIYDELNRQMKLIKNVVKENAFFIIDSNGQSMAILHTLIPSGGFQYYLEQREGIIDEVAFNAIFDEMLKNNWVIVNKLDMDNYLQGKNQSIYFKALIEKLSQNYEQNVVFIKNVNTQYNTFIMDFYIFKKVSPDNKKSRVI
jgi:hypothetical protein